VFAWICLLLLRVGGLAFLARLFFSTHGRPPSGVGLSICVRAVGRAHCVAHPAFLVLIRVLWRVCCGAMTR